MMVNCPKCGFSQPEDQYCAKCGVDMVAYRAIPKPMQKRVLANMPLQIGALGALVIAGGLYVHSANRAKAIRNLEDSPVAADSEKQESELSQAQAEEAQARREMNETTTASVAPPPAQPAAAAPAVASAPAAAVPAEAPPAPGTFAASSASTNAPAPAAGIKAAVAPAQNIRVSFIEIGSQTLERLTSEGQQGGSDGLTSWAVLPDLDQRLTQSRDWHALGNTSTNPIDKTKRARFYSQAADQTLGLAVQVIALATDEAGSRVQVDVNRQLRDPASGGADSYNFRLPDSFTIPKGGSLIVTGVLRTGRPLTDSEVQIYRNVNVLKAMTEPQFAQGTTDVAIVIETR